MIHATAVIDPSVEIDPSAQVGPYAVIDGPSRIAAGCAIDAHARICPHVELGPGCRVHSGAIIGDTPQDRAFTGETSFCRIGAATVIREHVTIHRGTAPGSATTIGDRCMLMAHSHVGHNCQLDDDVMLVNGALLGGHVQVGKRAIISGNAGVHQFVRVGELAMVGALALITQDVLPFFMFNVQGRCVGLNVVGLRRAGVSSCDRDELRRAYRILYRAPGTWTSAVAQLEATMQTESGRRLVEFLKSPSRRGFRAKGMFPIGQKDRDEPADG